MLNIYRSATVLILLIIGIPFTSYGQERVVELKPQYSFGDQGDQIFTLPLHIVHHNRKSIFVSDQHGSKVFEFDFDGQFIKIIGNEGRGPGEYISPKALETDGENLYVHDISNMRVISFSLINETSHIINIRRSFLEMEAQNGNIYGFAPPGTRMTTEDLDEQLILVFDNKGNMKKTFGEYLSFSEEMSTVLSWPYIEIENDIIHVVFSYFPIYRAYSADGKLLTEKNLSEISSIENTIPNFQGMDQNWQPKGVTVAYRAMDSINNRIFVCRQGRSIFIDEFTFTDNELSYEKSYTFEDVPPDYYVMDFFYDKNSNSFYILEKNQDPKVTVYSLSD